MPKKKGGKKGPKIVDGVATSEMTREQLVGHVRRIQMELDREREERNFFMLEREKLFALWNIAMEQLHAQKVKTQLAVEQMTEHDQEKQVEVLMHKQKLRYLLTEQSKSVNEARLDNLKKLQKTQEDMVSMQATLKECVTQKSRELRQAQNAMHELMRNMRLENAKSISQVRNEMCLEVARLESDFLTASLGRERREEIATENEREIIKNRHLEHIDRLKALHTADMGKTESYFHSITINNLATIAALQDEIREMKAYEVKMVQELQKSNADFHALEERIRVDEDERKKHVSKESEVTDKIRKEVRKMKEAQKAKDKYTRSVEIANEALLQKLSVLEGECSVFKRTVTKAILDMQQEAALKRMILELKLKASQNQRMLPAIIREDSNTQRTSGYSPPKEFEGLLQS